MEKILQHENFGTLEWKEDFSWYEGKITVSGKEIELDVILDDAENEKAVVEQTAQFCKEIDSWYKKATVFAVKELLPLKNRSWLEEGEKEITDDIFRKKIGFESVTLYENGDMDFWYDDGGLFFGHSIQISGNKETGFNLADIPG